MQVTLEINGKPHTVDIEADTPLLWVLRDQLQMTGTKFGCGIAQCGACTVHVDGQPTRSCITPAAGMTGAKIVTIEGLDSQVAEIVKSAWVSLDVPQCGYCQSGQIMAATALLTSTPKPDDTAIDEAMSGIICRCATYVRIRQAIKNAAAKL